MLKRIVTAVWFSFAVLAAHATPVFELTPSTTETRVGVGNTTTVYYEIHNNSPQSFSEVG